jgi:hypothetical protein
MEHDRPAVPCALISLFKLNLVSKCTPCKPRKGKVRDCTRPLWEALHKFAYHMHLLQWIRSCIIHSKQLVLLHCNLTALHRHCAEDGARVDAQFPWWQGMPLESGDRARMLALFHLHQCHVPLPWVVSKDPC